MYMSGGGVMINVYQGEVSGGGVINVYIRGRCHDKCIYQGEVS